MNRSDFARAHDQYLTPPDEPEDDTCPHCKGTGKDPDHTSNCCGAAFAEPGFPDNEMCAACGEHSELAECSECGGKSTITLRDKQEENTERKGDIDR